MRKTIYKIKFYIITIKNKKKIFNIIVKRNLYINFLNCFIVNNYYRFFFNKKFIKRFKLLQKVLNINVVSLKIVIYNVSRFTRNKKSNNRYKRSKIDFSKKETVVKTL